ncbi:MAG: putative porin [Nitrospiria bacterium]
MKGSLVIAPCMTLFVSLWVWTQSIYASEAYQMAISASYFEVEDDGQNSLTGHSIFLRQYFYPVNTLGHPLAEAAFLERNGSIELFVTISESKLGSTLGVDGLDYGVGLTHARRGSPLVFQAFYAKGDDEFKAPLIGDLTSDRYGLGIGVFIEDGFLVDVSYETSERERTIVGLRDVSFDDRFYSLNVKRVKKRGRGQAVNLELGLGLNRFDEPGENGSNTIGSLSGDYYFNPRMSLGGAIQVNRGDEKDNEGETYAVSIVIFLNPSLAIALYYDRFHADNASGEADDTFSAAMTGRF